MNQDLRGLITPIVTPFDEKGEIDEKLFIEEVRYLSSSGVDGLSPGGSTGEGAFLSTPEIARLVDLAKRHAEKKLPVVAGIIRNATCDAVEAGLAAQAAGADALMVTPTSYNILVPDDAGNFDFYKKISEAVSIPIIIYNVVPQNEISTELFIRLAESGYVAGVKQSLGGVKSLYDKIVRAQSERLVYSANDDMLFTGFELGADGAIAAILTLFPEICARMWEAAQRGAHKEGLALQGRIYPVWQKIIGPHFPRRIKTALALRGRDPGLTRSPITARSDGEFEEISRALEEASV